MGSSHRLQNRYRGSAYTNRYPSNSPINRISMITNNRNNSCIAASGVYTWVRLRTSTEIYGKTLQAVNKTTQFSFVQCNQLDASDRLARTLQQCSSRVRAARSVSRNVISDRSKSAKTLVGPAGSTHSLASSGFTEQHAPSREPQ
jgi:Tfp pilus assembly protein PilV